ncbi:Fe(3+)-hydroxamate ABC transporter permease FhuB [Minwuia thermotolerans]|uniref:Fe(3+)-hydroxamate ABC transporter permease FhuB n=1 Tax=Minwuia thermotolerans TaxID=2056226 RepID=UPI0019D1B5FC|nr:Fe(3+)-hydroxamate ABC transporter permease FhuB [Minwuia thermotolerans]
MIRTAAVVGAAAPALLLFLWLASPLGLGDQWRLLTHGAAQGYEEFVFLYGTAPRAAMAVLCGAALGLAGSVLQQVTRNSLVSPLTIGAAAGAWLALVVGTVVAPAFAAANGLWFTMGGAVIATLIVLGIAGREGIQGLPVVLAGMAMNILLGAVAVVVVLLNEERVRNLFIWGSGDLTQTDWGWATWLAPQLVAAAIVLALSLRPLGLLRAGTATAGALGLRVAPMLALLFLVALWLTASTVTAVGVIGFIGLLAPNLARLTGAGTPASELFKSAVLGALLLLLTDGVVLQVSNWTSDIVPSGAGAALIGVPVLIWLGLRRHRAADHARFEIPRGGRLALQPLLLALCVLIAVAALASLSLGPIAGGWNLAWPSETILSLRWPRTLAAAAAGAGMALSGVILQRLLRNPLASPDIVGISAGATLALVASVLVTGRSIYESSLPTAMGGALLVLILLLALSHRHRQAPAVVALVGVSLAALLDALLQFVLAKGGAETYMVVGWLAGSTFRVTAEGAIGLAIGIAALAATALTLRRWLVLLSAGPDTAASLGLSVAPSRALLLILACVAAALVTAVVGPIAFVGLLAPHIASMLGQRRAADQLATALALGALILLLSDWIGRNALYPLQLPAGALAAIVGGTYFVGLLLFRRR